MALKLNVNWFSKTLVRSSTYGGVFALPTFTEGDIVPIVIKILEPTEDGSLQYSVPDISNISLSFQVEDSDGDPVIVYQPTWTKDVGAGTFSALVDFNTAALGTWIGAATSKYAVVKIKRTDADGSVVTMFQEDVTIVANLSGATPSAPMTGTTLLTLEAASAMFAKKLMDAGDTITFRTQDGTVGRTIGVKKDGAGNVLDIDYQYNI